MITIPTKVESYAVASRKLTPAELSQLAHKVVDDSRIWFDEPRSWLTYCGFLGFQIHRAVFQYQLGREINDFVTECYNLAMEAGYVS